MDTVEELVRGADGRMGAPVRVRGKLFVRSGGAFLVPEHLDDGVSDPEPIRPRIDVDPYPLSDTLLEKVGAWAGGPYWYQDAAEVAGTLHPGEEPGTLRIGDLTEVVVIRDGVRHTVPFG